MIENIKALIEKYHNMFVTWYNGLTDVQQIGVVVAFLAVAFIIAIFYMLSKIVHR